MTYDRNRIQITVTKHLQKMEILLRSQHDPVRFCHGSHGSMSQLNMTQPLAVSSWPLTGDVQAMATNPWKCGKLFETR